MSKLLMVIAVLALMCGAALAEDQSVAEEIAELRARLDALSTEVQRTTVAAIEVVGVRRGGNLKLAEFQALLWIRPQLESLNSENFMYECEHEGDIAICRSLAFSRLFNDKGKNQWSDPFAHTVYECQDESCMIDYEPGS